VARILHGSLVSIIRKAGDKVSREDRVLKRGSPPESEDITNDKIE
jgi:hypothetical protein